MELEDWDLVVSKVLWRRSSLSDVKTRILVCLSVWRALKTKNTVDIVPAAAFFKKGSRCINTPLLHRRIRKNGIKRTATTAQIRECTVDIDGTISEGVEDEWLIKCLGSWCERAEQKEGGEKNDGVDLND